MRKTLFSEAGDECDSEFEVDVANNLIVRNVSYIWKPDPLPFHRKVRAGFCLDCDSDNVRKGALYSPDLYLVLSDRYVELKGGTFQAEDRGRLAELVRSGQTISFLFAQNRKLFAGKTKKTKYGDWADRLKCPWAVGRVIPQEWCE